jgi:CheY-like chemotaxis protein
MHVFKKVLLIEDDAITITICERLMKICNFTNEVISCSDGRQAIEYLLQIISSLPEIILLDLHMGTMNGWEFLDWYERWAASLDQCPSVYVLSSSLSAEDVKRSESYAHVQGYIVKPITVERLNSITAKSSA